MTQHEDRAQLVVANKALLTVAIMSAMVMQVLDTTITNVALPHMRAALGASDETISWVLTSYILATAVAIPITGWLADRIGARRLLLISVAVFTLASILCGIAQSLTAISLNLEAAEQMRHQRSFGQRNGGRGNGHGCSWCFID